MQDRSTPNWTSLNW